jgi:hypothetical protein
MSKAPRKTRQQKREASRTAAKKVTPAPPKGTPILRVLILNWEVDYYDDEGRLTSRRGPKDNQPIGICEADFPPGIADWLKAKGHI